MKKSLEDGMNYDRGLTGLMFFKEKREEKKKKRDCRLPK